MGVGVGRPVREVDEAGYAIGDGVGTGCGGSAEMMEDERAELS
jgi:hypothetical protein